MRKYGWLISGLLIFNTIKAQEPAASIKKAFARLEADEQMNPGLTASGLTDGCFERNQL